MGVITAVAAIERLVDNMLKIALYIYNQILLGLIIVNLASNQVGR